MKCTYYTPFTIGQVLTIFYWDDQEPPKRRFWALNSTRNHYIEVMIRVGRMQIAIRIWYSTAVAYFYEKQRRRVWLAKQYIREMWLRKTLFVTREQIHWRLTAEAIGCITTEVE